MSMDLRSNHHNNSEMVMEVGTKHEDCNSIPLVDFPVLKTQRCVCYYYSDYAKFDGVCYLCIPGLHMCTCDVTQGLKLN